MRQSISLAISFGVVGLLVLVSGCSGGNGSSSGNRSSGSVSSLGALHGSSVKTQNAAAIRAKAPAATTFTQALDHFTAGAGQTFQQRYVIDSSHATNPGAPVIFYVCGEGNCMTGELDPSGWAAQLALKMGAHFVALEHRYYGESQPFDQMTADTMKYLTVEQAIEDLVSFQKWAMTSQGLTGKWITIGGSYPASLAAIYRMVHPELASGAIASSACPRLDKDSPESDLVASQDIGTACVAKYRSLILTPIQAAIGNTQAMAPIKQTFDAADITDDLDFMGTMSGMSIAAIQYGGATAFCQSLDAADPVTAYATMLNQFVGQFGGSTAPRLVDWSYTGNESTGSTRYEGGFGFRQWIYQACTQEGLYTAAVMKANPDTTLSLSSSLTDPLPENYCGVYFGIQTPPDIDGMNAKYYYPLLQPSTSNILFVSGNNDPACFPDAIAKENGNATNPNTVAYTVDGGTHCQDLEPPSSNDSASLQGARSLELQLATQWSK